VVSEPVVAEAVVAEPVGAASGAVAPPVAEPPVPPRPSWVDPADWPPRADNPPSWMKFDTPPGAAPAPAGQRWAASKARQPAAPPLASVPPLSTAPVSGFPTLPEPSAAGAATRSPAPARTAGAGRGVLLGFLAAVVVLAAGAGVGWLVWGQDAEPTSTATAGAEADTGSDAVADQPTADVVPPAVPTVEAPVISPEDEALQELGALREQSLQGLWLDQRWVAQVASKSVGISDPLQTAQNGSHTFYAVDILAESDAARATASNPSAVLVLHSTDFGKRSTAPDGQPYWVTLYDGGFGSSDAVKVWCASTYPSLDPAALANACAPRTLSPPHS
jgi:hypothetical protein